MPSVAFGTSLVVLPAVALRVVRVRRRRGDDRRRRRRRSPPTPPPRSPKYAPAATAERRERRGAASQSGDEPPAAARGRGRAGADCGRASIDASRSASGSRERRRGSRRARATNSPIDGKRSSGSFAIARSQRGVDAGAARRAGARATLGAGSLTCCIATATKLSPGTATLAGEQLVEHDAERVDVRCARRPAGRSPARARCSRSSRAPCRSASGRADVQRAGDPEVGHLRRRRCRAARSAASRRGGRAPARARRRARAPISIAELERLAAPAAGPAARRAASGSRRRRTRRR